MFLSGQMAFIGVTAFITKWQQLYHTLPCHRVWENSVGSSEQNNRNRQKEEIKANSKTSSSKHKEPCVFRSRVKMYLEPAAKSKYSGDFNFFFLITPTQGQGEWKGTYPQWWTSRLHEGRVLPPLESLDMTEASGVRLSTGQITEEHKAHKEPTTAPSPTELPDCWSGERSVAERSHEGTIIHHGVKVKLESDSPPISPPIETVFSENFRGI